MARQPLKRRAANAFWRVVNPLVVHAAGFVPWWIVLETTGRKTGRARRLPLARGPIEGDSMWLIAVHGRRAQWVRNLEATPHARIKHRGRWHDVVATIEPMDEARRRRFNRYARSSTATLAIDPCLVRIAGVR